MKRYEVLMTMKVSTIWSSASGLVGGYQCFLGTNYLHPSGEVNQDWDARHLYRQRTVNRNECLTS
jgi:hypothetical protein